MMESQTSLPNFLLRDRSRHKTEPDDDFDPLAGFLRDDLIEARTREARILETDMVPYVRQLGFTEVRVVIGDLETSPFIEVCGYRLTAEETSELIRRLSPIWNGQSCERGWQLEDVAELPPPQNEPRHRPRPKKKQESRQETRLPKRRRKLGGFPRRTNEG